MLARHADMRGQGRRAKRPLYGALLVNLFTDAAHPFTAKGGVRCDVARRCSSRTVETSARAVRDVIGS